MLGSRRLAKQPIAADRAHVRAFGAENARISEKTDKGAICREDIPSMHESDELAL